MRVWLLLVGILVSAACVPGVSTPTTAPPLQGGSKGPAVSEKALQLNPPTPPSGAIQGATPANPGVAGGYPVPGPQSTPVNRTAPGAAYP